MPIKEIEALVESECRKRKYNDWEYHIRIVRKHALQLSEYYPNSNKEVIELSALLHDIGRVKFGGSKHHVTGAEESEKILKEFGYPAEIINQVKHAILSHGAMDIKPETIEAKIVASADTMTHFDTIPLLFEAAFVGKKLDYKGTYNWVWEKIERGWNKKLLVPEAKKIMKRKYEALKLIFEPLKDLKE